jgi:hypothetical protein
MSAGVNSHFKEVHIGWTRGKGFVSKMIRRLDKSYFNHVYYAFTLTNGMRLIYESHLKGGVQITPYEHLLAAKTKGNVEDICEVKLDISREKCQLLWNNLLPEHGDAYNTRQILLYYAWIRLGGRKDHPKIFKLEAKDKYTCNQLVAKAGEDVVPEMYGIDDTYTPEKLFKLFHDQIPSLVLHG